VEGIGKNETADKVFAFRQRDFFANRYLWTVLAAGGGLRVRALFRLPGSGACETHYGDWLLTKRAATNATESRTPSKSRQQFDKFQRQGLFGFFAWSKPAACRDRTEVKPSARKICPSDEHSSK